MENANPQSFVVGRYMDTRPCMLTTGISFACHVCSCLCCGVFATAASAPAITAVGSQTKCHKCHFQNRRGVVCQIFLFGVLNLRESFDCGWRDLSRPVRTQSASSPIRPHPPSSFTQRIDRGRLDQRPASTHPSHSTAMVSQRMVTSSRRAGRVTNKTKLYVVRGTKEADLGEAEIIVWEEGGNGEAAKSQHVGAKGVESGELLVSWTSSFTFPMHPRRF
jgi:hypothetical protein